MELARANQQIKHSAQIKIGGSAVFLGRKYKSRSEAQYAVDQSRSQTIRAIVYEAKLTWLPVCFYARISYQTLASWLRTGLNAEQYDRLLEAIRKAREER